jgi:fatty-acyl-CoA synthase
MPIDSGSSTAMSAKSVTKLPIPPGSAKLGGNEQTSPGDISAVHPYSFPLLIKHLLITPLRQYPRQEIVYRGRLRFTYEAFGQRVSRLGSALTALGVRPGQTVAVMDWDSHRYLECFFAVPMLGCVLQTVNIRLSPDQILYTLNHAGADVILCNSEFLPLLRALLPQLTSAQTFICIDDDGQIPAGIDWHGEYEALLAGADPAHPFPDFDENTRATTFYTTGTTGLPKGVFYSHRQLVLHTLVLLGMVPLTSTDAYMPITPMFHVHAWGFPYAATVCGIKQVYPGRYAPDLLVKWFVEEKITYSHCVPTIMRMFLAAAEGVDLRGWRVTIGGSALPRPLARELLDRGVDVCAGYGMSETGPIATLAVLTPELADGGETEITYRCRAGRPAPLVDIRILDADGAELPHDGHSAGEVVMRSPWLTQGYTKDQAASERLWEGGWLHTGDIGTLEPNGFLAITDRIKDVVKTGGEWVSSLDLEDIIAAHHDVAEVAVIGVVDARWGERPLAIVVLKPDAPADAGSIQAHILRHVQAGEISKFAIPERIEFVAAIPKTSVGKLDKKLLRKNYAA